MEALYIATWLRAWLARSTSGLRAALNYLLAPPTLIASIAIGAAVCIVAGVHLLAGPAWALIACGAQLYLLAFIAARGAQHA